jgi:hypothetical protein
MCCSNAGWTNRTVDKQAEGRIEINVRGYTKEGTRVTEIQGNGLERLGRWVVPVDSIMVTRGKICCLVGGVSL